MAVYPDLSRYEYSGESYGKSILNVGWLERTSVFQTGTMPVGFLEKLEKCIRRAFVNPYRGYHTCHFCGASGFAPINAIKPTLPHNGSWEFTLGSGETWVPGKNGVVYAAPNMIWHYCEAHGYLPPQEFVDAVMDFDLSSDWSAAQYGADVR